MKLLFVHFGLLIFLSTSSIILQQCEATTTQPAYIFTQWLASVSMDVADSPSALTKQGTPSLYIGKTHEFKMDMGFLLKESDIYQDKYNMTNYGFPTFYEYDPGLLYFSVNFVIANGDTEAVNSVKQMKFYYVKLIDKEGKCDVYLPQTQWDNLSGSLYFNERFAKYAYYIYRSTQAICIFTIMFEDLHQGRYMKDDYSNNLLVDITPVNVTVIHMEVQNYLHPFFTVDPIYGTMVHLTYDGTQLSAVHHKIDENNLSNFQEVLSRPLESFRFDFYNVADMNKHELDGYYPTFISYGKFVYMYFRLTPSHEKGYIGYWPLYSTAQFAREEPESSQRRLYYINDEYFEWSEPIGKYQPPPPTITTITASTPSVSTPLKKTCSPVNSFNPTWALFAPILVIDILLVIGFIVVIILKIKGSRNYAKCHPAAADRGGHTLMTQLQLTDGTKAGTIADQTGAGTMNVTRNTGTCNLSQKAFTDNDNNKTTNVFTASKEGTTIKPPLSNTQHRTTILKTWE